MKQIHLPKTTSDLRIKHWKVLTNPIFDGNVTLELACDFLAEFTGEHVNDIRAIDVKDVWKMFNHCVSLYEGIHIGSPKKQITLGGEQYNLIEPHKVGSGWHIDWSKNCNIEKDAIKTACLFYYPAKAKKYGETDDNKNLLYPIRDRYNTVERDMNLQDFLSASAFFLQKYEKSMRLSMESQKATNKIVRILSRMTGKSSSTL